LTAPAYWKSLSGGRRRLPPRTLPAIYRCRKGQQRENTALALVVGAHDQEDVFDRDDDDQRPENHRQNAEHVFRVERQAMLGVEALAKGVDGACPDIAEHDAERGDAQPGEPGGCIRPMPPKFLFSPRARPG